MSLNNIKSNMFKCGPWSANMHVSFSVHVCKEMRSVEKEPDYAYKQTKFTSWTNA